MLFELAKSWVSMGVPSKIAIIFPWCLAFYSWCGVNPTTMQEYPFLTIHVFTKNLPIHVVFPQKITTMFIIMVIFHSNSSELWMFSSENSVFPPKIIYVHQKRSNFPKNSDFSQKTSKFPKICGISLKMSFWATIGQYGKSTYFRTRFYGLLRPKHGLCTGGFGVRI